MKVRESRRLEIQGRVISQKQLHDIASLIGAERDKSRDETHLFVLSASADDGSSFDSADASFFSPDSPIFLKRVTSLSIEYSNIDQASSVELSLTHGNSTEQNRLIVRGNDSVWVNGIAARIQSIIDSAEPQRVIPHWALIAMTLVASFGMGQLLLLVYSIVSQPTTGPSPFFANLYDRWPAARFGVWLILSTIFGLFVGGAWIGWSISESLRKLYPSVELQLGPEHKMMEKKKRSRLYLVLVMVILPYALTMMAEFAKWLIN